MNWHLRYPHNYGKGPQRVNSLYILLQTRPELRGILVALEQERGDVVAKRKRLAEFQAPKCDVYL